MNAATRRVSHPQKGTPTHTAVSRSHPAVTGKLQKHSIDRG